MHISGCNCEALGPTTAPASHQSKLTQSLVFHEVMTKVLSQ